MMDVTVYHLAAYSKDTAAQLGKLAPQLSQHFDDSPINKELLEEMVRSPFHTLIIAQTSNKAIVGTASVSVVFAGISGRTATLQDFVVDTNARGMGVAGKLWQEVAKWCVEHNVQKLEFTSKPSREAAHAFYKKNGAEIRDTNVFAVSQEVLQEAAKA